MNKDKETKKLDAEELEKRVAPLALTYTEPTSDPTAPTSDPTDTTTPPPGPGLPPGGKQDI